MRFFNAIQIVILLVIAPLLLPLLKSASFWGAVPLMWILAIGWMVLFIWVVAMVYDGLSKGA